MGLWMCRRLGGYGIPLTKTGRAHILWIKMAREHANVSMFSRGMPFGPVNV